MVKTKDGRGGDVVDAGKKFKGSNLSAIKGSFPLGVSVFFLYFDMFILRQ